jgi:23S rRNA (uracil1939-C5)-methyltransferase
LKPAPQDAAAGGELFIDSLDLEGQGVARRPDGKVVFVEGALPGERVLAHIHRSKNQWEQGTLQHVLKHSSQRVTARCPHFGLHPGACGGCKMQHLDTAAQVAVKQRVLEDNLHHLAKVRPALMLRPIHGPDWGYRFRARLSVRFVHKKSVVLVGFHERKSRYIADMRSCAVLEPRVGAMLLELRELVGSMDQRDRLPQIELAAGDSVIALVLRHLEPLTAADKDRLSVFGQAHGVQWWLQPKGPETAHRLDDADPRLLSYSLPEFGVEMPFAPTDFTQVNPQINRVLVHQAVQLLDPQPRERVIDWFCGLGNFSLPLARRCAQVLGIEGSQSLVQTARQNAARNGLSDSADFTCRNLFEMTADSLRADGVAHRWLIDPPREGALALVRALVDAMALPGSGWSPPKRIVYVSCNPSTLARDAGLLVHQAGYRCSAAGVVNMFPHTAHVESMAVFDLH